MLSFTALCNVVERIVSCFHADLPLEWRRAWMCTRGTWRRPSSRRRSRWSGSTRLSSSTGAQLQELPINTLGGSQAASVDLHSGDHLGHLWDPLHVPAHTTLHPLIIRSFRKDVWNSIWFDWNDLLIYIQFDWNTITHYNSILQCLKTTETQHMSIYNKNFLLRI